MYINTLNWIWFIGCMKIDASVFRAIVNNDQAIAVINIIEKAIGEEGYRYGFDVGLTLFPIFELPGFLEYYPEFIDAWLKGVDEGLLEADSRKIAKWFKDPQIGTVCVRVLA